MNIPLAPAIMVLEDEAVVALELETRLSKLGYRVIGPVSRYDEAIALACVDRPDLLLADVRIVGEADGIAVATELRDRFDVPSVFLSAHSDANTLRRIVDSAPYGYLTKPFREAELHGTIQTALVRARLERELAERERRLREAYQAGNLGHWEVADSGTAMASDEVLTLLGLPLDEPAPHLVSSLLEYVVEEDRRAALETWSRVSRQDAGRWTFTFRTLHPRLGVRHLRAIGETHEATRESPRRVVGVLQDVTERRSAEEERETALRDLKRTTHELEAMIATFPDAFVRLRKDGRVVDVRQGRSPLEAAVRDLFVEESPGIPVLDPRLQSLRGALERSLRDRVVTSAEFELVGERSPRTMEGRIVPAERDEALLILRDITERRRAERILREREEQLRQAQRLESVGRLAGGIAHDFNNLLSVIVCTAALLEPQLAGDDDKTGMVRDILDASERASLLTKQLLAFSRKQVIDARPVELNERIATFAHLMDRSLGPTISLRLRLSPTRAIVLIDLGQLEQMLLNLVVNARDAMPDGGTLEITTDVDSDVAATDAGVRPYVCVRVSDDGVGIDADVLPSIFEPFFTTKEVGRGTGLGLATVHGIVHQAGGTIDVRSTKGRGTTFEIRLPIATTAVPATDERATESRPARGERILVVDDERAVRRLTAQLLERAGYRVVEAADGLEALAIFRRDGHEFDALVADLVMPRLGGLALAREVRREAPHLPVLFLSGFGDDAEAVRSIGTVLVKPYTPQRLYQAVQLSLAGVARS